jgi:hypothetical protein
MEGILQIGLEVLRFIVYYILPPVIFMAVLAYAAYVTFGFRGRPTEMLSRIVGHFVGYVLLIGVIILKVNDYLVIQRSDAALALWEIVLIGILGFLLGFFLLLIIRLLVQTRVAGFLVMFLVGGTSTSCFLFVFLGEIRDVLAIGSVAFLIGVGIYGLLFPEAIKKALGR